MTAPAPKSPSTVLPVRVHSDETPTPQSKASGDRAAKGAQEVDEEYNPEDFEEVTGPSDAAKNAGAVEVELGMSSKEPSAGVGTATVDRYRDCIAVLFPPSWPSPEAMAEYAQTIRDGSGTVLELQGHALLRYKGPITHIIFGPRIITPCTVQAPPDNMVPRSDTLEAIVGVWGDSWFCEEFEVTDGPSLVTQAFVESCEGRLVDTVVEPGQFFLIDYDKSQAKPSSAYVPGNEAGEELNPLFSAEHTPTDLTGGDSPAASDSSESGASGDGGSGEDWQAEMLKMLQAEPDESDDESADSASLPSTPSAVESSAEHAGSEPTSDSAPPSTTGNSGSDVHPSSSAKRPRSRSGSTTPTVSRADQPVVKKSRSEDVAEDTVRTAFGGPSTGTGTLLVNYAGEIEHVKSEVGTSSMATTEPPRTGSADQGGNNTDRGREGQVNPAIAGPSTQTLPTDRSSDDTTIDPVLVLFRHLLGYQAAVQAANGVYRSGDLMGMTAYLGDISGWDADWPPVALICKTYWRILARHIPAIGDLPTAYDQG